MEPCTNRLRYLDLVDAEGNLIKSNRIKENGHEFRVLNKEPSYRGDGEYLVTYYCVYCTQTKIISVKVT